MLEVKRIKRLLPVLLLIFLAGGRASAVSIVDEFPDLKKYTYKERDSAIYLGFGISPIAVLNNRVHFAADVFQVSWLSRSWDIEIFNASFGYSTSQNSYASSTDITFRVAPKYRITSYLSAGPIAGLEFVSFPDVGSKIFKNDLSTPNFEPFSSRGFIYGVQASEVVPFGTDHFLRISELVYQETYSTTTTPDGWTYIFQNNALQNDQTPIQASTMFMIEFSFMY